jgi:PAS domain S-box-containing protein
MKEDPKARLRALEEELEEVRRERDDLRRREARLREAERIVAVGHWELDLVRDELYWSDEIYRIFGLSPDEFGATYDAFLETVHPDDRDFVNQAYTNSVESRSAYDIVHRLLLRDGTMKYVREKCRTEYDAEGRPVRSLGTVQDVTERIRTETSFQGIISRDARMQDIFETIKELAQHRVPVLIQGESGTGKELVAQAIHREGPRATRVFVPVNCGALPEGLLESELFGHVRGAFTGAIRDKKGRFELADGGTLFLDEVGELPKLLQVKLLRVLQEGSFEPVGDEKTRTVDVRIISATNRDLSREVEAGAFREDLYYRLKVMPIVLPPLRERKTDIPLLLNHFIEQAAIEGLRSEGFSREALAVAIDYGWPGNIRELQSMVYHALIKARGQRIRPSHLPPEIRETLTEAEDPPSAQTREAVPPMEPLPVARRGGGTKLAAQAVREALQAARGNKVKAAKLLGVGRATLYRFLDKNPI